ncbi:MAG: ABC transporter substrate-binding protein, partial [Candidatus Methylomirabilales bacterium]
MRCRAGRGPGSLLLAATLVLEAVGAPAAAGAAEPKKVKVAQAAESLLYLPAYVASVQGYFKEEGLEVTRISTGGAGAEVKALLAGKVDFAMAGGAAQLSAMQKGAKLLAVANIGDKLAVNLAIHKEAARARGITEKTPFVEKLKAIKGLTFGATGPGALTWQVGEYIV